MNERRYAKRRGRNLETFWENKKNNKKIKLGEFMHKIDNIIELIGKIKQWKYLQMAFDMS